MARLLTALALCLSYATGCGDGASNTPKHEIADAGVADACTCDCGPQPDAFDDPESWGLSVNDAAASSSPPQVVGPLAENPNAPLCIGMAVNPNGPCLGMCGKLCNGVLGIKVCTVDCLNHDCCVRKKICAGMAKWRAHCLCLGALYQAQASLTACVILANMPDAGGAFQPGGYCYCNINGATPGANCP